MSYYRRLNYHRNTKMDELKADLCRIFGVEFRRVRLYDYFENKPFARLDKKTMGKRSIGEQNFEQDNLLFLECQREDGTYLIKPQDGVIEDNKKDVNIRRCMQCNEENDLSLDSRKNGIECSEGHFSCSLCFSEYLDQLSDNNMADLDAFALVQGRVFLSIIGARLSV
mmetsp:Transcript_33035/g.40550  ORF Transcript_33035/g.40550 Transcript_33035/m.40550 type:complete len:168 (+) Transcript_33035:2-505(+)